MAVEGSPAEDIRMRGMGALGGIVSCYALW